MRRNRARGGDGWVRRVMVRPQVRTGRFIGIQQDLSVLPGQTKVIQEAARSRALAKPRRVDPVAEVLGG